MKISVITLHSVCNYGTQLQAFATQEKLKEYFDEVEFINYQRKDTYGKGLIDTFSKGNIIKAFLVFPTIIYWKYIFGSFQHKYLNINKRKYLTKDDFKTYVDDSDIYFVGSDQVWNTGWNNGIIPELYLSFIPNNKRRYAYSASFGNNKLSETDIKNSKKYIEKFNFITVREKSAINILKEKYNYDKVMHLIDPTLIIPAENWRKYEKKSKIKGNYILIYNLNRSKDFDNYAEQIARKTGYKLYRFCTRFDQIIRNGKSIIIPQIFDFITLIDNAKIVITDSFHATAFSFNLNVEPICIYPKDYSGRIKEFLEMLNATQRHAEDFNDFEVLNRHVDFEYVNKILDKERTKADEFLSKIKMEMI